MKNIYFLSFIIFLQTLTSCGPESVSEKETSSNNDVTISQPMNEVVESKISQVQSLDSLAMLPTPEISINRPVAPEIISAANRNPAHGQPGHRCDIAVGASMNSSPSISNSGASEQAVTGIITPENNSSAMSKSVPSGLNPEHGKPGHRCDIAVGAALNSKPTSMVANTNSQSTATSNQPLVKPSISSATIASGLNPEHGKPGHRCDIAVGAALNSKPATSTTKSPSPVLPQQPVMKPYSPSATVATGLNPAHGKPGHRCDIAVGAALNSKPTSPTTTQLDTSSIPPAVKQ